MKKPRAPRPHCDFANPRAKAIRDALDGLAHFHVEHSNNQFADVFVKEMSASPTAAVPGGDRKVIIVLASDPVVVRAVVDALKPHLPTLTVEMPDPPPPPPEVVH